MSEVLPEEWRVTALENCVRILDAQRVPINNEERQQRIEGKSESELFPYYGATGQVGLIDSYLFDEELVALGEDGVPFLDPLKNKAYLLVGKTWVNNHAHVLKAIEGVSTNKFLLYYLNQFDYQEYVNGATRLKLTQANMRLMPVNVPPLAEQQEIATRLDDLLAQVDTIKARLDAIPAILKRFRQSVLAAAVSGKLTEDWRDRNKHIDAKQELENLLCTRKNFFQNHKKIERTPKRSPSLDALTEIPTNWIYSFINPFLTTNRVGMKTGPFGSLLKKEEHIDDGVAVLGIENIGNGCFLKGSKIHITKAKADELNGYDIRGGDLIISRSGTVGNICVIPANIGEARFSTNLMRLSLDASYLNPYFFCSLFLGSPIVLKQIEFLCKGSTRLFLNQEILNSIQYPIPPLEEQTEIVRRVEQLFTFAEQIEQQVQAAQDRVNKLTQAILAKAFKGELTADWRAAHPELISGENSAQALLDKIKASPTPSKPKRSKAQQAELF